MQKDCCSCCHWNPAEEECKIDELSEYAMDEFFELCPKSNGEWSESNSE